MSFICMHVYVYIYMYMCVIFFPIALLYSRIPLFSKSRLLYNFYGILYEGTLIWLLVWKRKIGFGIKVFVWKADEKMVFPMLSTQRTF